MNCYHLRDWLFESGTNSRQEVDDYVNGNEALSVCRDICNGLKHYRLNPDRRRPLDNAYYASPVWSTTSVRVTEAPTRYWGNKWVFTETPRGNWDMFELADECVEAWRSFLKV